MSEKTVQKIIITLFFVFFFLFVWFMHFVGISFYLIVLYFHADSYNTYDFLYSTLKLSLVLAVGEFIIGYIFYNGAQKQSR